MAGSKRLDEFGDNDGNQCRFGVDYDDTLNALTFWAENDTTADGFAMLVGVAEDGTESQTARYALTALGKASPEDGPRRTVLDIDQAPPNKRIQLRTLGNKIVGCKTMGAVYPFLG